MGTGAGKEKPINPGHAFWSHRRPALLLCTNPEASFNKVPAPGRDIPFRAHARKGKGGKQQKAATIIRGGFLS
jgi:hypothetical protein